MFLLFEFCCGTPPSCLNVVGGGWWWWWVWVGGDGGLEQFSVSPRPLGFGFGTKRFGAKGLGPGLDNFRFSNDQFCFEGLTAISFKIVWSVAK